MPDAYQNSYSVPIFEYIGHFSNYFVVGMRTVEFGVRGPELTGVRGAFICKPRRMKCSFLAEQEVTRMLSETFSTLQIAAMR